MLLAEKARDGHTVARVKWGDPFVFDSGAKEALFLHEQGVPFEVVPGVPAAVGMTAYAGIPLTYPGAGDALVLLRGQEDRQDELPDLDWDALARLDGTVVCYAAGRLVAACAAEVSRSRRAAGRRGRAHLSRHRCPARRTVTGTLPTSWTRPRARTPARPPSSSSAKSPAFANICDGSTNARSSAGALSSRDPRSKRRSSSKNSKISARRPFRRRRSGCRRRRIPKRWTAPRRPLTSTSGLSSSRRTPSRASSRPSPRSPRHPRVRRRPRLRGRPIDRRSAPRGRHQSRCRHAGIRQRTGVRLDGRQTAPSPASARSSCGRTTCAGSSAKSWHAARRARHRSGRVSQRRRAGRLSRRAGLVSRAARRPHRRRDVHEPDGREPVRRAHRRRAGGRSAEHDRWSPRLVP